MGRCSEERRLFERVFGPLDPEPDAEPEKALTVDEWLAMRPIDVPTPEPLQLSSGPLPAADLTTGPEALLHFEYYQSLATPTA